MKREIKFNSFYSSNNYTKNLEKLFADYDLFRQKHFTKQCLDVLKSIYTDSELLLTHSATGALEMIALALDIQAGDEIILPSYTFVSTANAFALRGAKLVFVDIELETLGIDPVEVEKAISPQTKAIVCVHYAGHACQIGRLKEIADKHKVSLIEDAAMAFGATFQNRPLGTFGDFGVVSFDITKHISATQGGMLLINKYAYKNVCQEIYHIGTNREAFEDGDVPYYEWVNLGSKYQMPETNAALLQEQLAHKEKILTKLNDLSQHYYSILLPNSLKHGFSLAPLDKIEYNYHEFYIRLTSKEERNKVAEYFKKHHIEALFHYIPLHSSTYAQGKFYASELSHTRLVTNQLLRLPLHTGLSLHHIEQICTTLENFFEQ